MTRVTPSLVHASAVGSKPSTSSPPIEILGHSKNVKTNHILSTTTRVKPRVARSPVRPHRGPRHPRPAVSNQTGADGIPSVAFRITRASALREHARGGAKKTASENPLFHAEKSSRREAMLRAARRATRCPATRSAGPVACSPFEARGTQSDTRGHRFVILELAPCGPDHNLLRGWWVGILGIRTRSVFVHVVHGFRRSDGRRGVRGALAPRLQRHK